MSKKIKAFTLIEMLIVIVIIGILAAALVPRLREVQWRARDAKRIVDVNNMAQALEIYFFDYGKYPGLSEAGYYYNFTPLISGTGYQDDCGYSSGRCGMETLLQPYITSLPRDNAGAALHQRFLYKTKNFSAANSLQQTMYALRVTLETPQDIAKNDGWFDNTRYERWALPKYCVAQYTWNNANRTNRDGTKRCQWGN